MKGCFTVTATNICCAFSPARSVPHFHAQNEIKQTKILDEIPFFDNLTEEAVELMYQQYLAETDGRYETIDAALHHYA